MELFLEDLAEAGIKNTRGLQKSPATIVANGSATGNAPISQFDRPSSKRAEVYEKAD
ncbi:hypothetical protein [Neorhizobium galegae]|uniref:hypothetical protein n=1 Tax=Neorhizobium galegae TaxID=399 RepID=UPI00062218A5|nr:hypothetical protein [Neorhizobium galegae]CDZ25393.1 Hypothetical protein NGAL_HAMBI490_02260 [Neorhizobium galegae bv. officinalis]MCM2498336.1 hypothetical protein [Neorhizobium galegae]MCQ1774305.1 hypothetical protein [Neorhizobium galegae]MCQ1779182.1 hypothetical protein [Neorhizobium galegae]MCQ1796033.1 hypothetical protein [Neorhizobium galegae]